MKNDVSQAAFMREAFDRIEESYEFMLAYAAQGRKRELAQDGEESQIRRYLKRFDSALDDLEAAVREGLGGMKGEDFANRFRENISVMHSVLALLLAHTSVTSDMIDNTNGLISLRALLTDIFFIDQAVLPPR